MEKEYYEKARSLINEIDHLEDLLERTKSGSPSSGMEITVNTGYYDMGHALTVKMELKCDLAIEIWSMIREHIRGKLDKLKKEFEEL